jgi:hypothetical protein
MELYPHDCSYLDTEYNRNKTVEQYQREVDMEIGRQIMSFKDYLADPCPKPSLSRSVIKDLIFKTPRHAFWNHPKLNKEFKPEESATAFDIGTAAHSVFLQGDNIAVCLNFNDWRKNEAKEARDEARANGLIPLLPEQYDNVLAMAEVGRKELKNSELEIDINEGFSEVTYTWKEGETYCRIRPDWIHKSNAIILDYKTTSQSANPESYSRIVVNNALDIQDAFYRRGVNKVEGTTPDFIFMVQEVEPPYLCSFIELDLRFKDMGEEKVKRGMHLWRECMKTGVWPSFSNRIYTIEPPSYALAGWEYKKAMGE